MSFIFRSDSPAVGERIVLRRAVAGSSELEAQKAHTDIIGHVVEINQGHSITVRPQKVGGYISSKPVITVPWEEVHIIKKLSPRTVRNADIRALESAYAHSVACEYHTWSTNRQWLMRAGSHHGLAFESAIPLGLSAAFGEVPVADIQAFSQHHGVPPRVWLPERIGRPAERMVKDVGPEIIALVQSLHPLNADRAAPEESAPIRHTVRIETADSELDLCATGVVVHGYLGIFLPEVAPHDLAKSQVDAAIAAIISWGSSVQAHTAYYYLHPGYEALLSVFESLGFYEHHRSRVGVLG
ncbi:hypothetical protein [Corynebacterium sp. ES2715-CONJ3]|uniref:GNAT family N-acetyltransferase, cg3035/Rv0428c family n=1 Tax=Corynebacterium sp. ES2715-CONJ3 TaxID=2974028 RepID=UPI00216A9060|nr:hypothetical protein [Corynebacterium sp. ES2715-CONJ3]MCS4491967.1 hypothetical protein [Corynebacterium sp. ES2715-CONJ3]